MATNTKLIEQFSQLEKLCNDIYGDKHGVTIYIDEMKNNNTAGARYVNSWRNDLERLIDVRHKRNQLSHGEVSFDTPYANEDDILFITNFRRRILKQTDPLAMLLKARSPRKVSVLSQDTTAKNSINLRTVLLAMFAALIIILLISVHFFK